MSSPTSLFDATPLGPFTLQNRIVMAPLTRTRAVGNIPNRLMARYYGERADVGLIISEGTSPAPAGLGYPNIPGAYSDEQAAGWKIVAEAVHAQGARFFVQLMHTGRIGHSLNLPDGADVVAPSAIAAKGEMNTPEGKQPHPTPRALRTDELPGIIDAYVQSARKLLAAGVDGVELHAANGYLLEQFIHPDTNQRDDDYGGSVDKRLRLVVEVAQAVADAIGGERVGIRLSPHGRNGDVSDYDGIDDVYVKLTGLLAATGIQYIHLLDHAPMGGGPVPASLKRAMRDAWPRTFILCGGFNKESATTAVVEGEADLIAFGRPILANPAFATRLKEDLPLNEVNFATVYAPGETGYVDYPGITR